VRGPDDNFWFAEFNASRIGRVTPTGTVTEFVLPADRGPVNIIVGPDNKLWFTENSGDRIGRIDPLAGSDAAVQSSLVELAVPGAGSTPNDIAVGPDGALWFTETGSDEIGRITTSGVVTDEFAVPGAGSAPGGITAGSDGALWFTEAGSGEIGRLTTAGAFTEFVIPVVANGVSDPEDIVAGPGGHLYFTDFSRDQIGRITTAGVITQFNLHTGRGPQQLTVFSDGDLYFTETASSRIGRLPASALAVGAPTSGVPPLEEFDFIPRDSAPLGITISSGGDIWFTLNNGNSIGNFLSHLQQLTITATGSQVQVYDVHLNLVRTFTPFLNFPGPLSVAVGDTNGNGIPDAIVGAGPGGGPHVKVFDGSDNRVLGSFYAFAPGFKGGITVGSDDVNGDGRADIIVGAGPGGGPQVKVIDGTKLSQVQANGQIADSALLGNFYAYAPVFAGGVAVTSGDVNKDNRNEIVVGAGPGGGPHVKVIDATKLNQVDANGRIADSALLGNFYAFAPNFTGGVSVGVSKNVAQRNVVVGAGPGGPPQVKVIDSTKLGQVQPGGQIADSALLANFAAFDPKFLGGVRVAADDLNFDGVAELALAAGAGAGPHVKIVDGTKLGQVQANGQIANGALLASFFASDPGFTGGVFIASDADHRDGPIFGQADSINGMRDINDMFLFRSPATPANSVMVMDVSPFSSTVTSSSFDTGVLYDFRISNRDLVNTTDDLTFRVTFGPPDAAANNQQDVEVRALPAARFAGVGGVLVKGFTKQNLPVRGVGGNGTAKFRAAEQDDPFFFDATGFKEMLDNPGGTAVSGVVAGVFPRGTSPNGFGPGSTPNYDAPNLFGPNINTLSIILELPGAKLTGPAGNAIGLWGRTEFNGVQADRMGRPAINTALIPPVPRGTDFPIGGTGDQNRQDRRNAFNAGHPRDDRANFTSDMVSVLTAYYPAGRPGGNPNAAQAAIVASLLLPDILVADVTSGAGFGGQLVTANGTTFLGGGRKLSDDIISTELAVLTDDDLPAGLGGGPNPPAIVSQNVRDDNGLNLTDGSINPPAPQGTGAAGTGTQRAAVFPYIGARNPT
jgi:streptogramin lyase